MFTIIQKFGVCKFFIYLIFWKEINNFIQQGCNTFIKSDINNICNVTKDLYFK